MPASLMKFSLLLAFLHVFTACRDDIVDAYTIPLHLNAADCHHVLCLGNSITHHAPSPSLNWYSDWGMAATTAEKDYCHLLESKLRELNPQSTVTPLNIAQWECNLDTDLDSLIGNSIRGKDIIVIRIGENVNDVSLFSSKIHDLVRVCLRQTPDVIIAGCFWDNKPVDECLRDAAVSHHLNYVPLAGILQGSGAAAKPTPSTVYYDTQGQPYYLTDKDVLNHPGDLAMMLMADLIYECLFCSSVGADPAPARTFR